MEALYVIEFPHLGPEVVKVRYKHVRCSVHGTVPVARVGAIGVRFAKKAELVDFSLTAAGILVRQSVVDHLSEERISGWRPGCLHVDTAPRLRDQDTNYCELIIVGHTRGYANSVGLQISDQCDECGRRRFMAPREGLIIPVESWDGSDIFVIDELGIQIVTESFRRVVEEHQHSGLRFVPIAEWRDPFEWMRD
jgi:hypothetical protein